MTGFDEQVTGLGDWLPSPTSLFSSIVDNDGAFCSNIENAREPCLHDALGNAAQNGTAQVGLGGYDVSDWNSLAEVKMGSGRCLNERIAARAGFSAPRLNTENIGPDDLFSNLDVRSQYLTIPPGLSPTTLLDSPVFLSNSTVIPSPTTGKFALVSSVNNQNSTLMAGVSNEGKENTFDDTWSFVFTPKVESRPIPQFDATNNVHSSGFAPQFLPHLASYVYSGESNFQTFKTESENGGSYLSVEQTNVGVDEFDEDQSSEDRNGSSGETKDGYNWRKYGQKQIKGIEYPRSYYKCTYVNCPVKKKVERSLEGNVTEIIYEGAHDHPKPPARKSSFGSSHARGDVQLEPESKTGTNGDLIWSAVQNRSVSGAPDWGQENLDGATTLQVQNGPRPESRDGVEASSTLSNAGDEDDRTTHVSVSLGYDGEGDEPESKRRRIETYASDSSGAARSLREPRVVVQTTSDVDILDDGYRWRKYGQKVVKGNPNPRSYYKCTTPGCNVRKHVERASNDLKSVITTYEGKHNHDVPAARNSCHVNSVNSTALPSQITPSNAYAPLIGAPSFQRPSLGSFGHPGRPWAGFRLGMNQPGGLASLELGQMGNYSKFPVLPECSNFSGQGKQNSDSNNFNSNNGSAVYQKLMSQMPLGPQM